MDAASLPSGWEARNTDDGRTFFIDHNTQQTTWDEVNGDTGSHNFQIYVTDPDPQAHDSKG